MIRALQKVEKREQRSAKWEHPRFLNRSGHGVPQLDDRRGREATDELPVLGVIRGLALSYIKLIVEHPSSARFRRP